METVNKHFDHRVKELSNLKTEKESANDLKNLYSMKGEPIKSLIDITSE